MFRGRLCIAIVRYLWGRIKNLLAQTHLKSLMPRWTRVLAADKPEMPPPMIMNLEKLSAYSWPSMVYDLTVTLWHFRAQKSEFLMFSFSCLWTEQVTYQFNTDSCRSILQILSKYFFIKLFHICIEWKNCIGNLKDVFYSCK